MEKTVICGTNTYKINYWLNCEIFSNKSEIKLPIQLHDTFLKILNKTLDFEKENDYLRLYEDLSELGSIQKQFLYHYIQKLIRANDKRITEKILEYFSYRFNNDDWGAISALTHIPLSFFKDYYYKFINGEHFYYNLHVNPIISVEFFEKYIHRVYWPYICENITLPIEFFEKYIDKLDWTTISKNRNIPIEFLQKHIDKLNYWDVKKNTFIPLWFKIELEIDFTWKQFAEKDKEYFIHDKECWNKIKMHIDENGQYQCRMCNTKWNCDDYISSIHYVCNACDKNLHVSISNPNNKKLVLKYIPEKFHKIIFE